MAFTQTRRALLRLGVLSVLGACSQDLGGPLRQPAIQSRRTIASGGGYGGGSCYSSTGDCAALTEAQRNELASELAYHFRLDDPTRMLIYHDAWSLIYSDHVFTYADGTSTISPGNEGYFDPFEPDLVFLNDSFVNGNDPGELVLSMAHETMHYLGVMDEGSAESTAYSCYIG